MAEVEQKKEEKQEEKKEEKQEQNKVSKTPRYVIRCKAKPMKNNSLKKLPTKQLLKKIVSYNNIYGYGIDIPDESSGFEPVDFSLRGIKNNFISALHACFMNHFPLQLRADDIWIIIAQGIASHIVQNAEKLRDKFVSFDGKKEITVVDNSLDINSKTNDWSNVLNQFEKGCRKLSNDTIVNII
eukprot:833182_1